MSVNPVFRTYESFNNAHSQGVLERIDEYWARRTYTDVLSEMPEPTYVSVDDDRKIKMVEVAPSSRTDHDISHDIALALPHLNAYNPRHYIRARTLQMANPNFSVWILPNNIVGNKAYFLNSREKARLAEGDMRPIGEIQMRAFENNRHGIGNLAVTGYSQGGLTALAMAAVDSDILVDRVNADEIPSKTNRPITQLIQDFRRSRSAEGLMAAVHDSGIKALSEAVSPKRQQRDIAQFLLTSLTGEGHIMRKAMSGSANKLVETAINRGITVKLGSVAGSKLFDVSSIDTRLLDSPLLTVVQYEGDKFEHMHVTGDNVKLHALMADDGLRLH